MSHSIVNKAETHVIHCFFLFSDNRRLTAHRLSMLSPDSLLNSQIFLLVIGGLGTEDFLVKTSHHVLLHCVHDALYVF